MHTHTKNSGEFTPGVAPEEAKTCKNFENRLTFDKVTESLKVGTVFETRCSYDCDYCYNYLTTYNVIQVQMNQLSQKYHLGTEHYAASPVRGD